MHLVTLLPTLLEQTNYPIPEQRLSDLQIQNAMFHMLSMLPAQTKRQLQSFLVAYSSQCVDTLVNQPILRHPKLNNRDTFQRSNVQYWF